jgi:hypothetical protein
MTNGVLSFPTPAVLPATAEFGLEEWAVDAVLGRWLEFDEGGSAPRRLDGHESAGGGYVEPSELLWACTVGSKVQRCPPPRLELQDPDSGTMPAVEQVLRINAGLAERRNRVERLTSIIDRASAGRRVDLQTVKPLREHRASMQREIEWGDSRAARLVGTEEYRDGRVYLAWAFARCALDDRTFLMWSEFACWLADPGKLIRIGMARHGYTVRQVADRLGVPEETVSHWLAAPDSRRRVQMPIRYAAALRDLLAA